MLALRAPRAGGPQGLASRQPGGPPHALPALIGPLRATRHRAPLAIARHSLSRATRHRAALPPLIAPPRATRHRSSHHRAPLLRAITSVTSRPPSKSGTASPANVAAMHSRPRMSSCPAQPCAAAWCAGRACKRGVSPHAAWAEPHRAIVEFQERRTSAANLLRLVEPSVELHDRFRARLPICARAIVEFQARFEWAWLSATSVGERRSVGRRSVGRRSGEQRCGRRALRRRRRARRRFGSLGSDRRDRARSRAASCSAESKR